MPDANIVTFDGSGNVEIKKYYDDIRDPIMTTVTSKLNGLRNDVTSRLNAHGDLYKPNCRGNQIYCGNQPIRGVACRPHAHDHGICFKPRGGRTWPTGGNSLFIMGHW